MTIRQRDQQTHVGSVAAPRVTRLAALVVFVGIPVQASLAGGSLAGHLWLRDVHMGLGALLTITGIVLLVIGVRGRKRESRRLLWYRIGMFLVILTTGVIGVFVGEGIRGLLTLHMPLGIIAMGLAALILIPPRLADSLIDPISAPD